LNPNARLVDATNLLGFAPQKSLTAPVEQRKETKVNGNHVVVNGELSEGHVA
jgi:hypothetical protein